MNVFTGILLTVLLMVTVGGFAPVDSATTPTNFIVIVTDDQRWDTLSYMPNVQESIAADGYTFDNAFVTSPLCCPSRASILTGQHVHHHGVYTNSGALGGALAFDDTVTVATLLDNSGYATALLGKYLNNYAALIDAYGYPYIPPGWDTWFAFVDGDGGDSYYYDYTVNWNGTIRSFGSDSEEYSTDILALAATRFLNQVEDPFFLYVAPWAPHRVALPADRHIGALADIPLHRPPNFNEADVSDKPAWIQSLEPVPLDLLDMTRQAELETLLAVDELVGSIVSKLAERNLLDSTTIIFTSDNGIAWGEHRWHAKSSVYAESIRVPFVVRPADGVETHFGAPGSCFNDAGCLDAPAATITLSAPVLNIDLMPTILAAADVPLPPPEEHRVDGTSLLQLADQPGTWRTDFLIEHYGLRTPGPGPYYALRNEQWKYVELATGEVELYDLITDPFELENLAALPDYQDILLELADRLAELKPTPPAAILEE